MGCVSSKQTMLATPVGDHSAAKKGKSGRVRAELDEFQRKYRREFAYSGSDLGESGRASSNGDSFSFRLGNLHKYVEGEQVAAGWPAWLSAVAGEAIHGWVPLRSDAYEKLDKIGQGTYSSVFRAKELSNGKIVALKKVRFDNFEPESVRFMAREIMILRRLDHPNIMKLDGIITSKLSCSIYLVFEYMEHDITGLLSCPDITFSEAQDDDTLINFLKTGIQQRNMVKCYMQQLLSGLEHCHSQGIMHRDIKGSNLLVNNEGVLKVADFGLANFCRSGYRQPLTSRVVTLWYRPPELLLGSTDYGAPVDLWSVGCVFAELLLGKPILQGKTEVEQLHRIFKLCGSPADEYWNNKKFPHATLFKPQQHYNSCLQETFQNLTTAAVNLLETLLSVEPYKRGTASSALASEYFKVKPYACDSSTLPRYPPNKEIDAKNREEAIRRKKTGGRIRVPETRKPGRKAYGTNKLAPDENLPVQTQGAHKGNVNVPIVKEIDSTLCGETLKASIDKLQEASHVKNASHGDIPFSGPLQVSTSSGFAWARRRKDDPSLRSHTMSFSKGHAINALETSAAKDEKHKYDSKVHDSEDVCTNSRGYGSYDVGNCRMQKKWSQFERVDSFYTSDGYHSQELSLAFYQEEEMAAKKRGSSYQVEGDKVEFSGPLLSQPGRVDELLERHERQIRQAVRKSWFQRAAGTKHLR